MNTEALIRGIKRRLAPKLDELPVDIDDANIPYMPTEEEIAERAAEIRQNWSDGERMRR